jgi:hypothetical protein
MLIIPLFTLLILPVNSFDINHYHRVARQGTLAMRGTFTTYLISFGTSRRKRWSWSYAPIQVFGILPLGQTLPAMDTRVSACRMRSVWFTNMLSISPLFVASLRPWDTQGVKPSFP